MNTPIHIQRARRLLAWLFTAQEGDTRDWKRRLKDGLMDWFLPSIAPIGPAPEQAYHAVHRGGRLLGLANSYPLPTWRPLARAAMTLVAVFLVWASLAVLDEVAIAEGEVVPEGKVKVIQHLEGGVIREINVQEGQEVKEGQPLMLVDLPVSSLNKDELQVRLDGLMLQRARIQAELEGKELVFPAEEAKRQPRLVEAERATFEARRQALKSTMSVLNEQWRQKQLEVQELEAKGRALSTNLHLAEERFAMSKDLLKSGLTPRLEHVQLQSQMEDLQGQLNTVRASVPRAQAAANEAKGRIEEEQAKYARTTQGELGDAELNIARTRELLTQASDQQRRTQVTSPTDGIVKNLKSNTIGGVVKPGDPIMEIVPLHERLQVEARLNPADRGYVHAGQKATVKLSAWDYTTYGGLEGEVILVAPDTSMDAKNNPYYRVLVQSDKAWIGDEQDKHLITAGMQASVEIHTGTRTVMKFLVKPVLKLRHEAFRER